LAANVPISYWQLVCLATLLKVPENDSFDPYQVYLLHFIGDAKYTLISTWCPLIYPVVSTFRS